MSKPLVGIMIITLSLWTLSGCNNSDKTPKTSINDAAVPEQTTPVTAQDDKVTNIDWSIIASGETPADLATYQYPFAIDSQNVKDYADYFKVDNATAQHNLTVGMASNEALSKVLDQLSTNYTSHELTDDDHIKLFIHTTADVDASSYDYVFADDFAKGLVLPIEIRPDGVKSEGNAHETM